MDSLFHRLRRVLLTLWVVIVLVAEGSFDPDYHSEIESDMYTRFRDDDQHISHWYGNTLTMRARVKSLRSEVEMVYDYAGGRVKWDFGEISMIHTAEDNKQWTILRLPGDLDGNSVCFNQEIEVDIMRPHFIRHAFLQSTQRSFYDGLYRCNWVTQMAGPELPNSLGKRQFFRREHFTYWKENLEDIQVTERVDVFICEGRYLRVEHGGDVFEFFDVKTIEDPSTLDDLFVIPNNELLFEGGGTCFPDSSLPGKNSFFFFFFLCLQHNQSLLLVVVANE
eukprot:TRINITY_DN1366_c1_g1_i1.p1 TRINITY_DN1366_c1_g1~~TRINITY_DN1366_c1_g1_i1.p1  ORF type:complete len:279 (-),score=43.75 TRINITY_DN1366_c1_g1_i1:947-1783(-)